MRNRWIAQALTWGAGDLIITGFGPKKTIHRIRENMGKHSCKEPKNQLQIVDV